MTPPRRRAGARFPVTSPRSLFPRRSARDDAMAGVVLGVESVPDGLASGLLAGVNPLAGLYGYLFGLLGGALFTSTSFMAVQATGAMSIIVADVGLGERADPARSLFTLTLVTGAVMVVAGLLRLGSFLRFVSNSVMTGFVSAVGVNIVLGQLDSFTGYDAQGANRLARALDLLLHPGGVDPPTLAVGAVTVGLIVWLQRTRLGSFGLVVAIFCGSALAALFASLGRDVAVVRDVAEVPQSLPLPVLPAFGEMPGFVVPALSLAFVGLVQGAGVSAAFPNRDGSPGDASQDFVGQGAGNLLAGMFQGMPVGGSMSASSLVVSAGARSRAALLYASGVMAMVLLLFASVVERVAMPALAGLLIVVGFSTLKPAKILAVARTGTVQLTVMSITFLLTLVIPLQYSVLVGVGISVILVVIRQSSRLVTRRIEIRPRGRLVETEPPAVLPAHDVVILQPYGAIFFATASVLGEQMPEVTGSSTGSVVILRIRGVDEAGSTLLGVLEDYAHSLHAVGSTLFIVTDNERVIRQLNDTRTIAAIGPGNVYRGTAEIGATLRRAADDAREWVQARGPDAAGDASTDGEPEPPPIDPEGR